MNITKLSISRPVGISMIVAFFVVLGLYSYYRIGVELLPALNTPYVTVRVNYDGASAESVETEIVKPVENALSGISDVKQITSKAEYGKASVQLEMNPSANADTAALDASKKVDAIKNSLPDGADTPTVVKQDINAQPIMEIAVLSQNSLSDTYSMTTNAFEDVLQQAGGVSELQLGGGRDKEVAVEVDRDKMASYHLTLAKIASALKTENQEMSAGSVYKPGQQSDVRLMAQYSDIKDIEGIQVTNTQGQQIPLTAVATIKEQDARAARYGRLNGEDAINIQVFKNSDANVVETADAVKAKVDLLNKTYPDYQFIIISNDADYVKTSLSNTMGTLIEGLFTTGLVLFLFLRGWRSTAAVMVAIPTSLVSTFLVMYIAGFTFNMMSLMGMTLCVGILVDDSIVVLENIVRHLKMGEEPKVAAEKGRTEIGMAAIAITLCDMAVFLPIAFMNGTTGQYFRQFGLTIVFAGFFSLLISFTLTPMLASKFFAGGWHLKPTKLWDFMDRIEGAAQRKYMTALEWTLRHQKKMLGGIAVIFVAVMAMIPLNIVGKEYMPQTDESSFRIDIKAPIGSSAEVPDRIAAQMEDELSQIPEVQYYLMQAGGSKAYEGRIKVQLVPRSERSRTIWQITNEVRQKAAQIHDATVSVSETQSSVAGTAGGGGGAKDGGGSLQVILRSTSTDDLNAAVAKAETALANVNGIKDVNSNFTEGMPEMQLDVDRAKLKTYGVSLSDVETAFNSAISGVSGGTLNNDKLNNGQDTDIEVRFKNADYYKPSDLNHVPLASGSSIIYLGDVANITYGRGPVTIQRIDKQRAIRLGANITSGYAMSTVMADAQKALDGAGLGSNVSYQFTGQTSQMTEAFSELFSALLLAMLLIYMLLAVLYESTVTPFIRMFSLPFGFIGSILLLFITNNTLNLYSMIGILVIDGIVAKNGTLLIDYTLTLMERGRTPLEAVKEAGEVRLKPIFMTTITMIVGMMPTALAVTAGSETRVSMAWVIIGGFLTSTVFTLLIIPIIFLFFANHPPRTWFSAICHHLPHHHAPANHPAA